MGPSTPFIRRPVATTLLTFGLAAAGIVAFFKLPVSPLPAVDFPTISVQATLPGASPEDVATTVASPLERHLGQIADVSEMTSSSSVGQARITLQFNLNRDIDGAARDVQAAINAARADLPTSLRSNPTYRKVNPADAPILILTLTSDTLTRGDLYDAASTVLSQKLSQVEGIGQVVVGGSSLPAVRVDLIPQALYKYGIGLEDVRAALSNANAHSPKGGIDVGDLVRDGLRGIRRRHPPPSTEHRTSQRLLHLPRHSALDHRHHATLPRLVIGVRHLQKRLRGRRVVGNVGGDSRRLRRLLREDALELHVNAGRFEHFHCVVHLR